MLKDRANRILLQWQSVGIPFYFLYSELAHMKHSQEVSKSDPQAVKI